MWRQNRAVIPTRWCICVRVGGNGARDHSSLGTNRRALITGIDEHATDKGRKPQGWTSFIILSHKHCHKGAGLALLPLHSRTTPAEQLQQLFVFMIRLLASTPITAPLSSSFFAFTCCCFLSPKPASIFIFSPWFFSFLNLPVLSDHSYLSSSFPHSSTFLHYLSPSSFVRLNLSSSSPALMGAHRLIFCYVKAACPPQTSLQSNNFFFSWLTTEWRSSSHATPGNTQTPCSCTPLLRLLFYYVP